MGELTRHVIDVSAVGNVRLLEAPGGLGAVHPSQDLPRHPGQVVVCGDDLGEDELRTVPKNLDSDRLALLLHRLRGIRAPVCCQVLHERIPGINH